MGGSLVVGVVNGSIYGLLALGIVLVYRGTRVLNFAQGEFGTFGLFIAWWFVEKLHQPWLIGAAVAVAVSALIGLAFEFLVVRRMVDASKLAVAVATIGLFLLLIALEIVIWKELILFLPPPIGGSGVKLLGFFVGPTALLGMAFVVVLGIGLAAFLRYTDFGLGVLAASQDPEAVRLVGVPLSRTAAFTWGTAGAIGAIAALLIEPTLGAFAPGFMTEFFVRALAAALIGGLTSLPGAFVGGLVLGEIEAVVGFLVPTTTFPGASYVTVLLLMVLVLLFRPSGLLVRRGA